MRRACDEHTRLVTHIRSMPNQASETVHTAIPCRSQQRCVAAIADHIDRDSVLRKHQFHKCDVVLFNSVEQHRPRIVYAVRVSPDGPDSIACLHRFEERLASARYYAHPPACESDTCLTPCVHTGLECVNHVARQ